jgi:uncharacterized protein involved in exopolysaccharide biosynthesis
MNQDLTGVDTRRDDREDEVDLWDLLTGLGEEKGFILLVTGAFAAIGLAVALLIPPTFTGRTVIMPPQQNQGASAALSASLGALAGAAGLGGAVKSTDELYVALMRSDAIAFSLSEKFNLKDRYEVEAHDDVKKKLSTIVRIAADKKSSLVSVEADDKDPKFAADLANAYVSELRLLTGRLAITEAQQKRVFFEAQMAKLLNSPRSVGAWLAWMHRPSPRSARQRNCVLKSSLKRYRFRQQGLTPGPRTLSCGECCLSWRV